MQIPALALIAFAWQFIAHAAFAQEFFWIVENNNRVFIDNESQLSFERQLCRALDCSAKLSGGVYPASTTKHFCAKLFRNLKGAYCSADRMKIEGSREYWLPFREPQKTAWDATKQSYSLKPQYVENRQRTIRAWRDTTTDADLTDVCEWFIDGIDKQYSAHPCRVVEGQESLLYRAQIEMGKEYQLLLRLNGVSLKPRKILVNDVSVLSLGDSYSSGEGNPHNFRDGRSPDQWWDRRCHRSLLSFSAQAVSVGAMQDQTIGTDKKHTYTYANFACAGAAIEGGTADSGGLLTEFSGLEPKKRIAALESILSKDLGSSSLSQNIEPQIDAARKLFCPSGTCVKGPDYVTLTIGGNDIGFGGLVRELIGGCESDSVLNQVAFWKDREACARDVVKRRLEELPGRFARLSKQIAKLKPGRVLLFEYIDITKNEMGNTCDDQKWESEKTLGPKWTGETGAWVDIPMSWAGKGVSYKDAKWAYQQVLRPLNLLLEDEARKHGWIFVGGANKFAGFRGWCAKPSWVVRWVDSQSKQGMLPKSNNYADGLSSILTTGLAHPNIFGHNYYAWQMRCLLEKNKHLPAGATATDGGPTLEKCG